MEKINKIIKQIQAVQFNEEGIMSDSGMRTLDSSIKELRSLQIVEPIPESKPVNTEELEGEIETGSFLFKLTETLQEELPVISWDVLERVSKAIASLIGQPVNVDEILGALKENCRYLEPIQDQAIPWEYLKETAEAIVFLKHSHNCDKSKDEWISVDDILPLEFTDILFYINRSEDPVCYGFYQEDYFIEFDHPDEMIRHSTDKVTHWQPLPPQPNTDSPDCTLEDRIRNA